MRIKFSLNLIEHKKHTRHFFSSMFVLYFVFQLYPNKHVIIPRESAHIINESLIFLSNYDYRIDEKGI
jgi:hypothetical protein